MNGTPLPAWLPWLTCRTSLTQRLEQTAGQARLQLLAQDWTTPNQWDKEILNINDDRVLLRQILMWAGDDLCWYARTVISHTCYEANKPFFERLKHESLGDLIYNNAAVQRVEMTHYEITPSSIEYSWIPLQSCGISAHWARLSTLMINHTHSFYLLEIFLPGLERYLS